MKGQIYKEALSHNGAGAQSVLHTGQQDQVVRLSQVSVHTGMLVACEFAAAQPSSRIEQVVRNRGSAFLSTSCRPPSSCGTKGALNTAGSLHVFCRKAKGDAG